MTRIGSLFSGYGGLDGGVQSVLGGTVAWHCDFDKGPSKVLAHHWPDVPNLHDVTTVDWANIEPVDIITGGSPCQDVSAAGKRAGMRTGTRSGLWASMCDGIDIIRPSLVVWENVGGALSAGADSNVEPCPICVGDTADVHLRALGRVLGDLAEVGYDAWWTTIRASDAGAPHSRLRVFVFAWPAADTGRLGLETGGAPRRPTTQVALPAGDSDPATWGTYGPAVSRWSRIIGRPAPAPTDARGRLSPRFTEWCMGLPDGHVTAVPEVTRNEQLKLLGNGVVPQQAALATRMFLTATQQGVAA